MKIAILLTSNDTSDFAARFPTDDLKYIALLQPIRPDWQFDCYAIWQDNFPDDILHYDGVIITGSPASVHDADRWIAKLLKLIKQMHQHKVKIFGGCFGHQAIALALDGIVASNQAGYFSIGLETTHFVMKPDFMKNAPDNITLYSVHKEEVVKLPAGATLLGKNQHCQNAAFIIENHIFTSQYHPEMTADFLIALTYEMQGYLSNERLATARAEFAKGAKGAHQGEAFAQLIVSFFEKI
ncbi:MAG: type 1 glutamine amidotransferase [Alphaproteobacteria bacterium]|nr:type 1 glutamine amidotransferase [Alphaproteobacteria bacterium]